MQQAVGLSVGRSVGRTNDGPTAGTSRAVSTLWRFRLESVFFPSRPVPSRPVPSRPELSETSLCSVVARHDLEIFVHRRQTQVVEAALVLGGGRKSKRVETFLLPPTPLFTIASRRSAFQTLVETFFQLETGRSVDSGSKRSLETETEVFAQGHPRPLENVGGFCLWFGADSNESTRDYQFLHR